MKQHLLLGVCLVVGLFLFGWLLNWVASKEAEIERKHYEESIKPDIDACRALGKYPVMSKWDGRLKECKDF